ncbi:MAG TPA: hypothetical protein VJT49_03485 [Amycolatopsis sp.]|nr:hypothetical protein [Amycolatopsis sp.]HKS44178.1 hypothetical protein [Amycolatopsis sp.]
MYAVTSLTAEQARPAELAAYIRGHWTCENKLHWVRDVTLGEDLSRVRTGGGPRMMASLHNHYTPSPSASCAWPVTPTSPKPTP